MDSESPSLVSTRTPHYESQLDSAKARIPKRHTHTLSQRYRPSWTPKDTLINGCNMESGTMKHEFRGSEPTRPHIDSRTRLPVHRSNKNPRTAKRRKIDHLTQHCVSNSHITTPSDSQSLQRQGSKPLKPGLPDNHHSGQEVASFKNSAFLNVENMMRSKPTKSKTSFRTIEKIEDGTFRCTDSPRLSGDATIDVAENDKGYPHSAHDLVNLSSYKQFEEQDNLGSVVEEDNIPDLISRVGRNNHVVGLQESSGIPNLVEDFVHSALKGQHTVKDSKRILGRRHKLVKNGYNLADMGLRHQFVRETVSPEQDQIPLQPDELHVAPANPRAQHRTSIPENDTTHPRRRKLVQMLRTEDNITDRSSMETLSKNGSHKDGSGHSDCAHLKSRKAYSGKKAQSALTLRPTAVSIADLNLEASGVLQLLLNEEDGVFEIINTDSSNLQMRVDLTDYVKAAKRVENYRVWLINMGYEDLKSRRACFEFSSKTQWEKFTDFVQRWLPMEDAVVSRNETPLSTHHRQAQNNAGPPTVGESNSPKEETQLLQKRSTLRSRRLGLSAIKSYPSNAQGFSLSEGMAEHPHSKGIIDLARSHPVFETVHPAANFPPEQSPRNHETQCQRPPAPHVCTNPPAHPEASKSLKPWSRPLLFPLNDPGKAVVEFDDLRRLDEGEFLNDSLLTFGLKYYEHKHQAKAGRPKAVYIFNTFFYEKLCATRTPRADINYDGVKRWTSKVDIFAYDYVVVPINEAAHWYGALICNLAQFNKNPQEIKGIDEETRATAGNVGAAGSVKGQSAEVGEPIAAKGVANKRLATSLEGDVDVGRDDLSTSQVSHENDLRVMSHRSRGERAEQRTLTRQASPRRSSRRRAVDPDQPVIILLDSFGENHPAAARKLNQYLREEGLTKHDFDIGALPCVNARGIPLQPNAFDCGVYFLGYMQKFFEDPEEFVAKAVSKSFHTDSEFAGLDAPRMRQTIRAILHHEYRVQSDDRRRQGKAKS